MKIQLLSDLHLEFRRHLYTHKGFASNCKTDADVLVLAGDITTSGNMVHDLKIFCDTYKNVVFVEGNHEFYGSSIKKVKGEIAKFDASHSNFHWLNNNSCEVDGQKFVGGTLWFEKNAQTTNTMLQLNMNDFRVVSDIDPAAFDEYELCVSAIKQHANEDSIVVTHHLPHENSVAEIFKTSLINCFFRSDLSKLIEECKPKLWFHGHTHSNVDYTLNCGTRVVANPYGYFSSAVNHGFKKKLVLDV